MSIAALLACVAFQSGATIGAQCVDCHAEIVTAYRATGMARALGPISAGELTALAPVVAADGAGAWHLGEGEQGPRIRWSPATAGAIGTVDRPLVFAVGAGRLDRSYVELRRGTREDAPGFLHFAALERVSHAAHGPAALAPWASIAPTASLGPAITPECLGCHTSALPPNSYPLNIAPDARGWKPTGIDCGACHARSLEHAEWRRAELADRAREAHDPLVEWSSLSRVQSSSVCAGCHLQGDARIELSAASGAPPPIGADLLRHRAIYVAAEPGEDVGFVSHVERMVLSRCWTRDASERGMRCETCHDPHRPLDEADERTRVRAACLNCHDDGDCGTTPAARTGQDCASCHMRSTPTFDVAGIAIHDHWIRTRPGAASASGPLRVAETLDGRLRRFDWNLDGAAVPEPDAGSEMLAYAKLANDHELARRRAVELARSEPSGPLRELGMFHHVRGWVLESAGARDEARKSYKRALLVDPALEESRVNLALLLGALSRHAEGLELLDGVLARHPFAEGALRNRALLRESIGDRAGALLDLEAAYALFPRAAAARALERMHRACGDLAAAARWGAAAAADAAQR